MPLYQFKCDNPECACDEELIVAVSARDGVFLCEKCNQGQLVRQFPTGVKGYVH